jgi:hypothetical protein
MRNLRVGVGAMRRLRTGPESATQAVFAVIPACFRETKRAASSGNRIA